MTKRKRDIEKFEQMLYNDINERMINMGDVIHITGHKNPDTDSIAASIALAELKRKQGVLVLTGGGNGEPDIAIEMAKKMFKYLNAEFDIDKNYIYSLKTNDISAKDDENLKELIEKVLQNNK